MNRKLTTGICAVALALAVCLAAEPARATTQLQTTTTTQQYGSNPLTGVTGITDLALPGGTTYNVSFILPPASGTPDLSHLIPPSGYSSNMTAILSVPTSSCDETDPTGKYALYRNFDLNAAVERA